MKSETGTNPLTTGGQSPLCPGTSDLNLLRYRERVIDLNAQISDGAFDLCVAEQELDGPKTAGAPIDQRRLRSSEGMGAKKLGLKSDSGNPFRDKPRVLACRHAAALVAAAREQKLVGLFTQRSQVAVDGFTGLLRQLKFYRASRLPLPDRCTINRVAVRRNVLNLEGHHIAAA